MPINVRDAKVGDVDSICELMKQLGYKISKEDVEKNIARYGEINGTVLVAELDEEIVGFLSFSVIPLFHKYGSLGRITAMCVSNSHRRMGIGNALITELDTLARRLKCERIEVVSGDHRENEAHLFYQSCGYKLDTRRFIKKFP